MPKNVEHHCPPPPPLGAVDLCITQSRGAIYIATETFLMSDFSDHFTVLDLNLLEEGILFLNNKSYGNEKKFVFRF